jgi:hypothetical protein
MPDGPMTDELGQAARNHDDAPRRHLGTVADPHGGGGHHVVGRAAVEANEPDGSDQAELAAVR